MERISRFRSRILLLIFVLIVGLMAMYLYNIQVIETEGSTDNSTTFTTLTRVKAARGDILDRNGNMLVGNRASYDLVLNHYVVLNAENTNQHLYNLVKLCQEKGIEYTEHFPITPQRPFTYTLEEQSNIWQGYFQAYLAYVGDLDSDITAPLLIEKLRKIYEFPTEWTDEEARAVIGLRYEMSLRYCVQAMSNYVFLSDVDDMTLSYITELGIPGMNVEATTVREYHTSLASHILGYVGPMNAEQWEYYQTIEGYEMDAEVGQDGLEKAYEEYLHGIDGWREDTVTADGSLVSSRYLVEPVAGSNVEISIDIELQETAEFWLAWTIENLRTDQVTEWGVLPDGADAEGGALVAIDVKTGQILVCASYPTYDLSTFFDDYDALMEDEYTPLYNRALQASYPPGSTYKMVTLIAAMESGELQPGETIYDAGKYMKYANEGFYPTCLAWKYGYSHGTLDASHALEVSCNYFFYELGDRLSINVLDNVAKKMGLGEPTGVELAEDVGQRANREVKKALYIGFDAGWFTADQILAAIGQSINRFTPMQLCVYATTLANHGVRRQATFMNRVVSADYQNLLLESTPKVVDTIYISDETYQAMLDGMILVNHGEKGTAADYFEGFQYTVAGKTGTAEDDPSGSDNGAYICFAPVEDPQIAIAMYVEKGGHGNTMAMAARYLIEDFLTVEEVKDVPSYENKMS